jgi:hypothetical protein
VLFEIILLAEGDAFVSFLHQVEDAARRHSNTCHHRTCASVVRRPGAHAAGF